MTCGWWRTGVSVWFYGDRVTEPPNRRSAMWLQASAHRFLTRRMEHALLYGCADDDTGPVRARRISLSVGMGVAVAGMVGCRLWPLLVLP